MSKSARLALPACMLLPALSWAQSTFDGTWKADLNNIQLSTKPDRYLLQDGLYHCQTCAPPVEIQADGQDHPVSGHPYYDTASIKILDDRTIEETDKKDGHTVTTSTSKVSVDGKSLTFELTDRSASSGAPLIVKGEARRIATGPAGSHAISGSWRTTRYENISDNGLLVSYALKGSTFKMTNPLGQSYAAPLDGTDSPYRGDPGTTSVSVKRISDQSIEETDKRDGKIIGVARMTVAADGKTMTVAWQDLLHGTSGSFMNVKQ